MGMWLLAALWVLSPLQLAAQEGLGVWRIRVYSGMSEAEARSRLTNMEGLDGVEVLPFDGQYGLFVGAYDSEAAATAGAKALEEDHGILNRGVSFFPNTAPISQMGGGENFRVLVSTYTNSGAAQRRKTELDRLGIFPVDVVRQGDLYKVYAGYEFNSRNEAQSYINTTLQPLNIAPEGVEDPNAPARQAPVEQPQRDYQQWVRQALDAGNYSEAEQLLNEWEQADPGHLRIPDLRAELRLLRQAEPAPTPVNEDQSRFDTMKAQAAAAEQQGNYDEAIRIWQEVSKLPGIRPEQRLEATQTISRLNDQRFALQPQQSRDRGAGVEGLNLGIIIGGAAVVLVVIGGVVFFLMRKKKAPRPAPAPAGSSMGNFAGGGMAMPQVGGASKMTAPAPKAPPPAPAQAKKQQAQPKPESETVKLGGAPKPDTEREPEDQKDAAGAGVPAGGVARDARSPGIELEGLAGGPAAEEETQLDVNMAEQAAASAKQQQSTSGDRRPIPIVKEGSDLESTEQVPAHEVAQEAPRAKPKEAPSPDPDSKAGTMAQLSKGRSGRVMIFEQNFDDQQAGETPANWEGGYDYASLSVVPREDGKGGNCMKFEKLSGTGSAYYSCKFPDASGRLVAEFDLRCDHKNKYLLGFYIEKDGDFRHSVHTVVHRDISNPDKVTLRLQNEPTPYKLKEWVHVRLLIDLPRSMVDAHVDGEGVGLGVRLASRPKAINTLSIRDNLATEGILMIDNIQIYQDR